MKIASGKSSKKARIEVIPLIDIMFFLLATFVLVSVSMTENRGLIVALPESKTNEAKESKSDEVSPIQLTISILQDGTLALDKETLTFNELEEKLKKIVLDSSQKKYLTLMGDKTSNLQNTVQILDLARELKIDSVTIRTKSTN
jgi:biopolymer transport protein ExbD